MKKLSKNFDVEQCDMFKFKGRVYTEQPRWTEIKYYLYNEEDGSYTAVLKRDSIIFLMFIMLVVTMFLGFLITTTEPKEHIVRISDTIYASNGTVGLNAQNAETNEDTITLQLFTKDDVALTEPVVLNPGESVGYVDLLVHARVGSAMCNLKYTVKDKYIPITKKFDVLLIVQEDSQEGAEE